MPWPDIFFRARPPKRAERPAPVASDTPAEEPTPAQESAPVPDPTHRLPVSQVSLPPAPVHPVSSDSSVVKDMAEADTLRALSRSGGVRLIKRDFSRAWEVPAIPPPDAAAESTPQNSPQPPEPFSTTPPPPLPGPESARAAGPRISPAINLSGVREPAAGSTNPAGMTIFRRRTKIADVARIVLPPRRDDTQSVPSRPAHAPAPAVPPATAVPASAESAAIVIPPAFPVAMPTRPAAREPDIILPPPPADPSPKAREIPAFENVSTEAPLVAPELKEDSQAAEMESPPAAVVLDPDAPEPGSAATETEVQETPTTAAEAPSSPAPEEPPGPPPDTREKREFFLSNGERIIGHVISETPEAIYIDHITLGVLTIPRAQIAQRPVEIILINGDRVVGDIIAETADSLFVRHASLGILTVPRSQRSTRVVEAILKDGDRILGEVLGETENFTLIRSATLGTVTVPHNRVAMLNRRAEQVEMKALPAPGIEDKPSA